MLNDRASILTLESDGNVLVEVTIFGMGEALATAKKLKEEYGFDEDDPVCFIYIESKMNYEKVD